MAFSTAIIGMLGKKDVFSEFIKKIVLTCIGLSCLVAWGCSSTPPQVSGIVAVSQIETMACQPRQKTFQIRNNNTSEPQRVQGVLFELGTNNDKFFKIISVTANGRSKEASSNLVEEIILPPGGVMDVLVEYNPKETTPTEEAEFHATYLDVFLNGPKLGIMQIEIQGRAPEALPGCSNEVGSGRTFEVVAVKTILSHQAIGAPVETDLDVNADVQGDFILSGEGDEVILTTGGWPTITFPLPPNGVGLTELDIVLDEDSTPTDFSGSSLTFDGLTFTGGGVVTLSGLSLTTGSVTIDSAVAPNVSGGTITLTGSELNDQGEMTLVVAAPLTSPPVDTVENVGGGVFGLEVTLKEIK